MQDPPFAAPSAQPIQIMQGNQQNLDGGNCCYRLKIHLAISVSEKGVLELQVVRGQTQRHERNGPHDGKTHNHEIQKAPGSEGAKSYAAFSFQLILLAEHSVLNANPTDASCTPHKLLGNAGMCVRGGGGRKGGRGVFRADQHTFATQTRSSEAQLGTSSIPENDG